MTRNWNGKGEQREVELKLIPVEPKEKKKDRAFKKRADTIVSHAASKRWGGVCHMAEVNALKKKLDARKGGGWNMQIVDYRSERKEKGGADILAHTHKKNLR